MSEQQIQEIELNIEDAREMINMGKALDRLHDNADFKELILEGYFKNEAVRLVHLKSDYLVRAEDKQTEISKDIDAIGRLRNYFSAVAAQADRAAYAIEAGEEELTHLRNEEI